MFAGILLIVLVVLLVMSWCLTTKTKCEFGDLVPAIVASLLTVEVGALAISELLGGDKFAMVLLITTVVGGTTSLVNVVIFGGDNIKVESVTQVILGSYMGMFIGLLVLGGWVQFT